MQTINQVIRLALIPVMVIVLSACGGGSDSNSTSNSTSNSSSPGAATLSWTPPTENVDGTALDGISYYNIYYGREIGNYTNTVRVDNPGLTEYMIENLPGNNTYYFVVTAVDIDGNESGYSNVASKTLT